MKKIDSQCDSFVLDTYKVVDIGKYSPAAITYKGRKKMDVIQWKNKLFLSADEANGFVRDHCFKLGLSEVDTQTLLSYKYSYR